MLIILDTSGRLLIIIPPPPNLLDQDLVALVNCFAPPASAAGALPAGWESKLDASGKQFYIDHAHRRTSFMDPRLPVDVPVGGRMASASAAAAAGESLGHAFVVACGGRGPASPTFVPIQPAEMFDVPPPLPPPRPGHHGHHRRAANGSNGTMASAFGAELASGAAGSAAAMDAYPVAYNDKVVAFLRQPNILEILRERNGQVPVTRQLREKVNAVRVEGASGLDRLGHDLQLTMLLR